MTADPADPGAEMALRLRLACEAQDPSIGAHLDNVTHYACELGRLAGLAEARIAELRLAAPLHDLGKIAIPHSLLGKPGRLSPSEMQTVRSHAVIGHRILDGSPWPAIQCAARVALAHHECWDGSGYPNGWSGARIPIEARIVAVADVYDALLSQRAYKAAWDTAHTLEEMRRLRGTKFDPTLLDLFLEHIPAPLAAS